MNLKDIGIRAVKTFVQAFVSTVGVAAITSFDVATIQAGVIAAGAAALSVVWNALYLWATE